MSRANEIGSFRDLRWARSADRGPTGAIDHILSGAELLGSGRAALRRLLRHLDAFVPKPHRLVHVPTYYCPEVTAAIEAAGWTISRYAHIPFDCADSIPDDTRQGNVFLNVNLFGVFCHRLTDEALARGLHVIEDHSHDPFESAAFRRGRQLSFASLRKTVPIPDGGIVYRAPFSTPDLAEDGEPSLPGVAGDPRWRALGAMEMKARYLAGKSSVVKEEYLSAFAAAEEAFGAEAHRDVTMSMVSRRLLERADIWGWREKHRANAQWLRAQLRQLGVHVVEPTVGIGFGVFATYADAHEAGIVRSALIDAEVYPARLWVQPASESVESARALASRSLFLHADERYDLSDMHRTYAVIKRALGRSTTAFT